MASPFPGMNPYIEQASVWHDFHESFMPLARDLLAAQVLPRYVVRIDEQMYIHELASEERRLLGRADLLVPAVSGEAGKGAVATRVQSAPFKVRFPAIDSESQSFLEIRDRNNRELITVIELLSPSNKGHGPDREQYLAKVRTIQKSWVHFVEIDLLRGGPRMPWLNMPACDYCAVVSRYPNRPEAEFWPISLRDRLPELPIPLRPGESEAQLDLQQIVQRIYDAAGYEYDIYSGSPEPLLSKEDAEWAQQFLPASLRTHA